MNIPFDRITTWSWRLAILALPWQTRWFAEGLNLGGIPWEQGRWSFYLAWIPLIATILLSLRVRHQNPKPISYLSFACVVILAFVAITTISPQATTQWLIQILLLLAFVNSLRRLAIPKTQITTWFLVSLIPHALLAIQQAWSQQVFAFKWLGIAAQQPATRGVSVIEVGTDRMLRAYGGFPHPNILGGWMSLGVLVFLKEYLKNQNPPPGLRRGWPSLARTGAVLALLLSWSRAAWLATFLGSVALCYHYRHSFRKAMLLPLTLILCLITGFFFVNHKLLFTRIQPSTRLEQKAVDERGSALATSLAAIKQHPWLGSGPGTTQLALSRVLPENTIPIPPHLIPVMALLELGIFGSLALSLLLWAYLRRRTLPVFLVAWLLPIALFDHYLWSVWAGQSLLILALYLVLDLRDERGHSMDMS